MSRLFLSLLTVLLLVACAPEAQEPNPDAAQAWSEFTQGLEQAGHEVLENYPQFSELDSAEGLRYLLQQVSAASQWR